MIKEDCLKSLNDAIGALEKLRNSHILITGGTGFIGMWLTEMLNVLNKIYGLNIQIYLLARNEPLNYSIVVDKCIHFIKSDIRSIKEVPNCINYIINAAGSPDSREHVSNPIRTLDTFYKGTQNILEQASRLPNLIKIVHLSSNKIYGSNYSTSPIEEANSTILEYDNQDVYAESKRISETICKSYISERHLPIVIVRPFSFIGPYQSLDKPWAINNFIRDAILGGPIRILGNEITTKSFMYGSDGANYILNILADGRVGDIYNIGSPEPITLLDLATKIKKIVGNDIHINIKSSKDSYTKTSFDVPLTLKVEYELNVKCAFGIEDSLKSTIFWNKLKNKI
jgi:nucleoside-diphosphate-sugar epimerase